MNCVSQWGAHAGSFGSLFVVEGAPFWSSVGEFGGYYYAAVHAYDFGGFVVAH